MIDKATMISTNEPLRQLLEVLYAHRTPISDNLTDQKKLIKLVTACYEGLNVYGKSPEQLEAIIMLMQMKLAKFNYDIVRRAFEEYLEKGKTMPTPADIIEIIKVLYPEKPNDEIKIERLGIIANRRRCGLPLTNEQQSFIEEYEKNNGEVYWFSLKQWREYNL